MRFVSLVLTVISLCFWILLFRIKAFRIWKGNKWIVTIVGFDLTLLVITLASCLEYSLDFYDYIVFKFKPDIGSQPITEAPIPTAVSTPPNRNLIKMLKFVSSIIKELSEFVNYYIQFNVENIRILDLKFHLKGNQLTLIKLKSLSIPMVKFTKTNNNLNIEIPSIKADQELYAYLVQVLEYFGGTTRKRDVIKKAKNEQRQSFNLLSELLSTEFYVRINVGKIKLKLNELKMVVSLNSTIELMEEYHQTRGNISIETPHGKLVGIEEFQIYRNGAGSSLQATMDVDIDFSLQQFTSILNSVLPFIDASKKMDSTEQKTKSDKPLMLLATIPRFVLNLELPNDIKTTTVLDNLKITNDFEGNWIINSNQIRTEFPITGCGLFDTESRMHSFMELTDFKLLAILENEETPTQLQFSLEQSKIVVPNSWPMSNIVENGICLQKAIKTMVFDALGKSSRDFSGGKTFSKIGWFPIISISSNLMEIIFEDNEFEIKLARNYKVGYQMNLQKLEREKAFAAKIGEIDSNARSSYQMRSPAAINSKQDQISVAWRLMQRKGCAEYIKAIKIASGKPDPPLLHAKVVDMKLFVCSYVCEKDSIEVLLNEIDTSTPPDTIYDDLLPLNYTGTLCGLEVRLRDYSNPLLLIDPSIATICETKGTIVIAEPKTSAESYRYVILPVDNQSILVRRNVNPTKFYFDLTSVIDSNGSIYVCVGAAFEAVLNDVINLIDDFTAVTEDPSPPLGWWDKVIIL